MTRKHITTFSALDYIKFPFDNYDANNEEQTEKLKEFYAGIINYYEVFRGADGSGAEYVLDLYKAKDFKLMESMFDTQFAIDSLRKFRHWIFGCNFKVPEPIVDYTAFIDNNLDDDFFANVLENCYDYEIAGWFDVEKLREDLFYNEEEDIKTLAELKAKLEAEAEAEDDETTEYCPHCDTYVKLDRELKVQTCPNCGKRIPTCSMCRAVDEDKDVKYGGVYCHHCCLDFQAHIENCEMEANN